MIKFSALVLRMKYINRWGLMRNSRRESLAEHAAETAVIANILAAIAKTEYGADVSPDKVATAAVYHDCAEIMTGDMPTPVKYRAQSLTSEYKKLERDSEESILMMLPESFRDEIAPAVTGSGLNERERRIVQAADKLSALIKCIEEERFGNKEFVSAKQSTLDLIKGLGLPEADYFVENLIPAHYLDLDELLV